ncbi:rhamnulokinase [Tessaracoccus lacteus]|uniref:FGGY-family carbohydrate kinase n=1 Tax=Tessaracoccus lacteus TaxID=3041766 RepID=A0ABY8PWL2_9ACTN|nr:FGGY-family carbohydrate kinase [Tessaracoccus sp. T21]WGT46844.1 FGGY-family carbohydrate kinase [Tessaracoccus sp. T21]
MPPVTALAVDLGSSSGRIVAGTFDGATITETEVHRFPHRATLVDGYLCWDLDAIWTEIVAGLREAVQQFPGAVSVSVDTWGVDYVPLDAADLPIAPGRCYRDERTVRTHEAFRSRLDDGAAWAATGIAPATINTANQLFAFLTEEPDAAARTASVLLLPDYFTWKLSGVKGWSRSHASSSGLCTPGVRDFSDDVLGALGIPRGWFGDVTAELDAVGPCSVDGLAALTVVRAGAHDTACATHALLRDVTQESYFLSCGSWSVLGVLRDEPLLSARAREIGLTNEATADGGLRPLFNITGLWILQELQREWAAEGREADIARLVELAAEAPTLGALIDPDEPCFAQAGGMLARIGAALDGQGIDAATLTQGAVVRLVLESLAERYARGLAELAELTGAPARQLNLMGGGSRNALLCQLTADRTGVPVIAGPVEASALGSLIAQLEVLGHLDPADRNAVIAATARTVEYRPRA